MLGILFVNQVFNAPSFNSLEKLNILDIYLNE